jgi:site-specific DNA recombinase
VLYIRVSTEKQADGGISLQAQEERLRAYCLMRGLEVADVIVDPAQSAFKKLTARPGGSGRFSSFDPARSAPSSP